MIYVPDIDNYDCFVVRDSATIRAYESTPTENTLVDYRDYFVNSHYLYQDGSEFFEETLPTCISQNEITNDFYYRSDFDSICLIFLTCFLFIFVIPFLLYRRIFRRF